MPNCLCQVFYGIPFKPGDVILTSMAEYGSNYLAFLQVCWKYIPALHLGPLQVAGVSVRVLAAHAC
jgi:selenocysteine lyase/cysteine desulfurase